MIVHFGLDQLAPQWAGATVCIGVFDGVHKGHQEVISRAVSIANEHEEPCVLVTFDRHPATVLAPDRAPLSLATLSQNLDRFEELGVAVTVVLPFTQETANTSADEFLSHVLREKLLAKRLVVGHDFALGKGRQGTGDWLSSHIETIVVPPFELGGHRVSSSEIRSLVQTGSVERAASFLGRAFSLRGVVVSGQKLGRELGFPTINVVCSSPQCLPLDGIYGGWCETLTGKFPAANAIGFRPTVAGTDRTVEAYLLDFPGSSLYGTAVELGFAFRVRDETAFDTIEQLKSAMARDVEEVRSKLQLWDN